MWLEANKIDIMPQIFGMPVSSINLTHPAWDEVEDIKLAEARQEKHLISDIVIGKHEQKI
jgi:hypothetical protein